MTAIAPDVWRAAAAEEIQFWRTWLATGGREWPEDFKRRFDPQQPFCEEVDAILARCEARLQRSPVRILEVGSGPVTRLGYVGRRSDVEFTYTDPLACEYLEIMNSLGIKPMHPVLPFAAEGIGMHFVEKFDAVLAFNCLDHGRDPVDAVQSLASVVAPGGCLVLRHVNRVADREGRQGLHQWNFFVENGDFCVQSAEPGAETTNLSRMLWDCDCFVEAGDLGVDQDWIRATFWRRQ